MGMKIKWLLRITGLLISMLVTLALVFFLLVYHGFFGPLPGDDEIGHISNPAASTVYDSRGEAIGKFYLQDRSPVTINQIDTFLIAALIATEDKRFYRHRGIDFRSLLRVAVKTLMLQKSSSGGGSTITLQLAKNLFPRQPYKFLYYPINKTREAIIAYRLEQQYSKEEILALYLNTVSFGEDVYGVESAAQRFFNCSAGELRPEQAALLVGMLKATTSYNPVRHPEAARHRRQVVLGRLVKTNKITPAVADSLASLPLGVVYQPREQQQAAYFLARVRKKVTAFLQDYNANRQEELNLLRDGLKIYTTLDKVMQANAEQTMLGHMQKLQQLFAKHWYDRDLWARHSRLLDREIKKAAHGRTPVQMQQAYEMLVYTPEGGELREMSPIDSLKYYLQQLQAGFLAMDPASGAIKSWVGGINYQFFPYDHVDYHARRQVGSTFKPLVYAAALENGVSPCTYYKARQETYAVEEGEWQPANDDAGYSGKYSMKGALEKSVNTVAIKILQDVGIDKTVALAHQMGIKADIPAVPSIALGTAAISLLEMVTAYGSFVNGGYRVNPYLIERIEDQEGNILYQRQPPPPVRVIKAKTSRIMAHLLTGVVDEGTGKSLRTVYKLDNAIGGKTGTTQNNADGWFLAITPRLVAGTWVGGIYPEISFTDTRLGQGATMALPIFGQFYRQLNQNRDYNGYTRARFAPLPAEWQAELDCDPFKEDFRLFDWLFGKDKKKDKAARAADQPKEKQGFMQKIKKIFKKE